MDSTGGSAVIRQAVPEDHDSVVSVADDWWERPVATALPRLFLEHFHNTSFIAEDGAGLAGFLVAFFSPARPGEAYIHFVAVRPDLRHAGLGRRLYEAFFDLALTQGQSVVSAITPPINTESVHFHRSLGFDVQGPVENYDRRGVAQLVFRRSLAPRA